MRNQTHNENGISATNCQPIDLQLHSLIQDFTQEHNLIAKILDTVAALVIVIDKQGKIIHFNHACEQTTNYSFSEVKNRCFWEFLSI